MGELPGLLRVLADELRAGRIQPAQAATLKAHLLSADPVLINRARDILVPRPRASISESIPPPPPRNSTSDLGPPEDDPWNRRNSLDSDQEDDATVQLPSRAALARLQNHEDEVDESKFETYERSELRDQRRRLPPEEQLAPSPSQSQLSQGSTPRKELAATPLMQAKQMVGVAPPPKSRRSDFVLVHSADKNKFRMRWAEVDPDNMTFSYWKSRAARGKGGPLASLRIDQIASLEWNTKDVTRGRRASFIGIGGVRFTINMRDGTRTICKAQNPLDARSWLNCIQELITPILEENSRLGQANGADHAPTAEEVCLYKAVGTAEKQSGILQKDEGHGYKDRWCTLDTVTRVLSYWSKQPKNESVEKPEGTVNIADVFTFEWNSKDLAQGRRRSFIKNDGVRFVINFKVLSKEPENWRANNPYEAYRWKDILEKMHNEVNSSGSRTRANSTLTRRSSNSLLTRSFVSTAAPPQSVSPLSFVPPPPPAETAAQPAPAARRPSTGPANAAPRRPSSTDNPHSASQTLPHPAREPPPKPQPTSYTLPRGLPAEAIVAGRPPSSASPAPPLPTAHTRMPDAAPEQNKARPIPFVPPPPPLSSYPRGPAKPAPAAPGIRSA